MVYPNVSTSEYALHPEVQLPNSSWELSGLLVEIPQVVLRVWHASSKHTSQAYLVEIGALELSNGTFPYDDAFYLFGT
jgi:hypothetical protein